MWALFNFIIFMMMAALQQPSAALVVSSSSVLAPSALTPLVLSSLAPSFMASFPATSTLSARADESWLASSTVSTPDAQNIPALAIDFRSRPEKPSPYKDSLRPVQSSWPRPRPHKPKPSVIVDTPDSRLRGCNLEKPTAEGLERILPAFTNFTDSTFQQYLNDPAYGDGSSYAIYMRDHFASRLAPSQLFCEVAAECSIGSCSNIDDDLSHEERQLAYYFFESVSGVAHIFQVQKEATESAGKYLLFSVPDLVKQYSSAPRIEKARQIRQMREKAILAAISGIGLLGTSALSAAGDSVKDFQVVYDLVLSSYIGAVGVYNAVRADLPDLVEKTEDMLLSSLNRYLHERSEELDVELRNLMIGDENSRGQRIVDVLTRGNFVEPDTRLKPFLKEQEERFVFASFVNTLWHFNRAYIVDTNAPASGCNADDRGPVQYRVCLPEESGKTYWLYAIDNGQENDPFKDDQAQVTGPTGFHAFDDEDYSPYKITREDIVRSSLLIHRHKIEAKPEEGALRELDAVLEKYTGHDQIRLGKVPGAFTIPVCRNPYGEAISSVWADKGRNYPCMCGEFSWTTWARHKDETPDFLVKTGFMYSEDWEDYCSDWNGCKGENSINLRTKLEDHRGLDDPPIPKKLKHPFKKCTKPKKVGGVGGHPEKEPGFRHGG